MNRESVLWFVLLGSLLTVDVCQCRAVNLANTWTLPQEGFSVFYRFFRDKISWFEADAVCQFHHANLVTVDNGVQFDAARAFLKELDVTEFVWIGLMRPQNTQHFGWTNSKPLDSTSGYWADPFPAMESPLCAVIDPTRDFRWHALRCGGPETAAFLCEMEVPSWAAECTVQAIPSLTVQYMSDSGTVELSRDCGEEGTRHMPCHGKEDRNTILNELTCIDDTENSDNSLKQGITSSELLVDIHQKSLELIKSVSSDNKEDNNIDDVVNIISQDEHKTTYGPKLNMDDIMMGDQPMPLSNEKIDEKLLTQKTDKKSKKKADVEGKYLKKINNKQMKKEESGEELMMGDQPANEDHTDAVISSNINSKSDTLITSAPIQPISSTNADFSVSSTTIISTTETRLRRETEISTNEVQTTDNPVFVTNPANGVTSTDSPNMKIIKKKTAKPHVSEEHSTTTHYQKDIQEVNMASDHFIPPMLLVRTQFSLSNGHNDHMEGFRKHNENHDVTTGVKDDITDDSKNSPQHTEIVTTPLSPTTTEATTVLPTTDHSIIDIRKTQTVTSESSSSSEISTTRSEISTTPPFTTSYHNEETTKLTFTTTPITNEHTIDLKKVADSTQVSITESPKFRQPHAPKHSAEFHSKTSPPPVILSTFVQTTSPMLTQESTTIANILKQTETNDNKLDDHSEIVTTVSPVIEMSTEHSVRNNCSSHFDVSSENPIELEKRDHSTDAKHHSSKNHGLPSHHNVNDHLPNSSENEDPCMEENASADLSNSDDFQPYRPNRRRVLTKPESHSYITKVFG